MALKIKVATNTNFEGEYIRVVYESSTNIDYQIWKDEQTAKTKGLMPLEQRSISILDEDIFSENELKKAGKTKRVLSYDRLKKEDIFKNAADVIE
jgi:hypothetical protein